MIPIKWNDARLLCRECDWRYTHQAFWEMTRTGVDFYMYDDKPMSVLLMNNRFEMSIGIDVFGGGPKKEACDVLERIGFPWSTRLERSWFYLDMSA